MGEKAIGRKLCYLVSPLVKRVFLSKRCEQSKAFIDTSFYFQIPQIIVNYSTVRLTTAVCWFQRQTPESKCYVRSIPNPLASDTLAASYINESSKKSRSIADRAEHNHYKSLKENYLLTCF